MESKLRIFGNRHYDFINQIFGTSAIREVIQSEYPKTHDWILKSEDSGPEFENSFHHFCGTVYGKDRWCSVDEGIQDIEVNPNDTLCQSYSLMKYFGYILETDIELTEDLQKRMVLMYNDLLTNDLIKQEIELQAPDTNIWKYNNNDDVKKYKLRHNNYTDKKKVRKKGAIGRKNKILALIDTVLKEWDEYGWQYFMSSKSGGFRRSERIIKKTIKKHIKDSS